MKKLLTTLTLSTAALSSVLAPAFAAPVISAQSIIVNPVQTTLTAKVWVNKDPSGTQTPNYRVGEPITLYTSVNENSYVYLFNVNPDGTTDQILPNRYKTGGNYVRAGQTRAFPTTGDQFTYTVGGPTGLNRVLVVTSRRQLNLSELSTYTQGQAFATVKPQTSQGLAQALSIVVNPVNPVAQPVPQTDWQSDTAFYNVTY
ncbi:DUF4384 domain-containing protein [Deinococcus sp. Leaf326]|jgi:hypothetical protein|uniref:DUF4384 domain-containing protein n=1 Tax=Deinococcus sp. Leaf326 TaxID=1736338 RepID=UPI0006FD6165|nr:DUF4384 domain-containing protein [Deinococcus sp. Leaf326]KQQ99339.1 S-layer protein [Deinococcus sp. Leaf326]